MDHKKIIIPGLLLIALSLIAMKVNGSFDTLLDNGIAHRFINQYTTIFAYTLKQLPYIISATILVGISIKLFEARSTNKETK